MTASATIQLLGKTAERSKEDGGESSYEARRFPFFAAVIQDEALWVACLKFGQPVDYEYMYQDTPEQAAAACDARARELVAEMEWYRGE